MQRKPLKDLKAGEPIPFDQKDADALRDMFKGTASERQQQRGIGWLLYATGRTDSIYRETDRETAYFLGRRDLGEQIAQMISSYEVERPKDEKI